MACLNHGAGEIFILGKKAVSRVNRIGVCRFCSLENALDVQITLGGFGRSNVMSLNQSNVAVSGANSGSQLLATVPQIGNMFNSVPDLIFPDAWRDEPHAMTLS